MLTISANVNNNLVIDGVKIANNDIYLDADGNISLSYDRQAVLEGCAEAAKTILGEMVLNIDQGIPYFQTVWVGVPNIPQFNAALRNAFLNVPNVFEVVSLTTSQTGYILNYQAVIRTNYGIDNISEVIIGDGISG